MNNCISHVLFHSSNGNSSFRCSDKCSQICLDLGKINVISSTWTIGYLLMRFQLLCLVFDEVILLGAFMMLYSYLSTLFIGRIPCSDG